MPNVAVIDRQAFERIFPRHDVNTSIHGVRCSRQWCSRDACDWLGHSSGLCADDGPAACVFGGPDNGSKSSDEQFVRPVERDIQQRQGKVRAALAGPASMEKRKKMTRIEARRRRADNELSFGPADHVNKARAS
jgi:hypothetical protein